MLAIGSRMRMQHKSLPVVAALLLLGYLVSSGNGATLILIDASANNGDFNPLGGWTAAGGAGFSSTVGNPLPSAFLGPTNSSFFTTLTTSIPATATQFQFQFDRGSPGVAGANYRINLGTQVLFLGGVGGGQPFATIGPLFSTPTVTGIQTFTVTSLGSGATPSAYFDNFVLTATVPSLQLVDPSPTDPPTNQTGTRNFGTFLVGSGPQIDNIDVRNVFTTATDITFGAPGAPNAAFFTGPSGGAATALGVAPNATVSRNYSFLTTTNTGGTVNSLVQITDDEGDTVNVTLSGRAVSPLRAAEVIANAGNVRLGTSGTGTVTLSNIGDGSLVGAALTGTASDPANEFVRVGGGGFSMANDVATPGGNSSVAVSYTYTPSGFGLDSQSVTMTYNNGNGPTNVGGAFNQTITGTGVGPDLVRTYQAATGDGTAATPGGVHTNGEDITFSPIIAGESTSIVIRLENNGSGPVGNSTDLTIDVDDSGLPLPFTITDVNQIIQNDTSFLDLTLTFSPTSMGSFNGTFTINTDEGTAFANIGNALNGAAFVFDVFGSALAVPEPAALTLWSIVGLGLAAYGVRRYRRK